MRKYLAIFFLVVLSLAAPAVAAHHHADGISHSDCPLCAVSNLPAASEHNSPVIERAMVTAADNGERPWSIPFSPSIPSDTRGPPA